MTTICLFVKKTKDYPLRQQNSRTVKNFTLSSHTQSCEIINTYFSQHNYQSLISMQVCHLHILAIMLARITSTFAKSTFILNIIATTTIITYDRDMCFPCHWTRGTCHSTRRTQTVRSVGIRSKMCGHCRLPCCT